LKKHAALAGRTALAFFLQPLHLARRPRQHGRDDQDVRPEIRVLVDRSGLSAGVMPATGSPDRSAARDAFKTWRSTVVVGSSSGGAKISQASCASTITSRMSNTCTPNEIVATTESSTKGPGI
jgi:hypothetical protein